MATITTTIQTDLAEANLLKRLEGRTVQAVHIPQVIPDTGEIAVVKLTGGLVMIIERDKRERVTWFLRRANGFLWVMLPEFAIRQAGVDAPTLDTMEIALKGRSTLILRINTAPGGAVNYNYIP